MNKAVTQMVVASMGMFWLGLCTAISLAGTIWNNAPSELTFALITALTGATASAGAWLFRLNGSGGQKA